MSTTRLSIPIAVLLAITCHICLCKSTNLVRQNRGEDGDNDEGLLRAEDVVFYQPHLNLESVHGSGPAIQGDLADSMRASASHYHHKKGTKGWLDMGAWTGKKGKFGWYADYPVGKGK